jgi:hypothetical protein
MANVTAQTPEYEKLLRAVVEAKAKYGDNARAARALGISRTTFNSRLQAARARNACGVDEVTLRATVEREERARVALDVEKLRLRAEDLQAQLSSVRRETLSDDYVRRHILGLQREAAKGAPDWTVRTPKAGAHVLGVPTLFASDWHVGEVVDPRQIENLNAFDLGVARRRCRALISGTINLLENHLAWTPERSPGIVFALGGDMVSGDIHEELRETNEVPIMGAVVQAHGMLHWCIAELARKFGKVFVPAVAGNHGRTSRKPRAKQRAYTNYDWLIYTLLESSFQGDDRVQFLIPSGPDVRWSVYGHRYLLTHGDQFRGGDGMIGFLGPVTRGDKKKRARNMTVDLGYDTMMLGHWHQYAALPHLIVNGSLKGYDEYANENNFGFEIPQQALWLTHPKHRITFSCPVHLEELPARAQNTEWVWPQSVRDAR